MDPRTTDGNTARCVYCGAVGVVRRQGDRLVFEPTVLQAAAGHMADVWRRVGVSVSGIVGVGSLIVTGAQALRPSMGSPVPLAVVTLIAALVLRFRASPLLGALLSLPVGAILIAKPFVFPLRIGRFGAFGPTSETALHWVMPGVVLVVVGLLMAGTLSRAQLMWSVRGLVPGWRSALVVALGIGAGLWLSTSTSSQTLFERLEASSVALDQLEARLHAVSTLTTTMPLPEEARAALKAAPGSVDLLLRSELSGEPAPDAQYVSAGVLTPLLELRRQLRTRNEDLYFSDLHDPMHEGRLRLFTRAEALRYVVIVDLTPADPQSQPSGTRYTATGTVVDLEARTALGIVTSAPNTSAYLATQNLQSVLGLPER